MSFSGKRTDIFPPHGLSSKAETRQELSFTLQLIYAAKLTLKTQGSLPHKNREA
jgi:hypothetical protein